MNSVFFWYRFNSMWNVNTYRRFFQEERQSFICTAIFSTTLCNFRALSRSYQDVYIIRSNFGSQLQQQNRCWRVSLLWDRYDLVLCRFRLVFLWLGTGTFNFILLWKVVRVNTLLMFPSTPASFYVLKKCPSGVGRSMVSIVHLYFTRLRWTFGVDIFSSIWPQWPFQFPFLQLVPPGW